MKYIFLDSSAISIAQSTAESPPPAITRFLFLKIDQSTCQTSKHGIFAVGDVCSYSGKLKLILTGFSEAAIAAHSCYKRIFPDKSLHFEYSTTKGINKI